MRPNVGVRKSSDDANSASEEPDAEEMGRGCRETNGLRLVPPLGNLLLLRHVYSACVVTIMLRSITCMVYGGGYEACHQDLYDPTGEQDLDGFDGFDC